MWNLRQNLESSGHQEKHKSHTALQEERCCAWTWLSVDRIIRQVWHNSRLCGIWGKICSRTGHSRKITFVRPVRYGTGVALTLSAVQVDILSHRCCVDTKRDQTREQFTFMWNLRQNLESSGTRKTQKSHCVTGRRTIHVYVEFEAKFGELWAPRKTQKSHCVTEQVLHWH